MFHWGVQKAEEMHLHAIAIKVKLLGENDYEVALSVGHLASLYNYDMEMYDKAEELYWRSIRIGEKHLVDRTDELTPLTLSSLQAFHCSGKRTAVSSTTTEACATCTTTRCRWSASRRWLKLCTSGRNCVCAASPTNQNPSTSSRTRASPLSCKPSSSCSHDMLARTAGARLIFLSWFTFTF